MKLAAFSAIATGGRVNASTGVIHGVSVITEGQAIGHDLWIDSVTIEKLKELCKGQIKVKINHPQKGENPPFETTAGTLENFRIDGKQLRADLHLLKSDEYYNKIVEMSEKLPEQFGLSVRIEQEIEKKDSKEFCRPLSIESVDLVDSPAANPNGLFSKKDSDDVKMSADGKTHSKDCMCKTCMEYSKKNKSKSMSAIFAKVLNLAENATEEEIVLALSKKLEANKPQDLTELEKKISDANTTLAELQKKGQNQVALAKKAEIDNLMAEAARDGKVVPLDNDDLYTVKDGVVTIVQEPIQLSKMISKLPKGQVALQKKAPRVPVNDKNEPIQFDRSTPEGRKAVLQFCKGRKSAGAISLGRFIREQSEQASNIN